METETKESLEGVIKALPTSPGVYLFQNSKGKVAYVGKAASLRNRVRSYLGRTAQKNRWTAELMRNVRGIEVIVTRTEKEALVLEGNLIKMHRPHFNLRFKDDKKFPYIKILPNDPYPALLVVRQPKDDNALYFGPYVDAKALRQTIDVIKRTFGIRVIRMSNDRTQTGCPWRDTSKRLPRACIEFFIYKCCGPCVDEASVKEYARAVRRVCEFLEGKHSYVLEELKQDMVEAAEKEEFERATQLRDQIQAVKRIVERQSVVIGFNEDVDAFGYAEKTGWACVSMVTVRGGKVLNAQGFVIHSDHGRPAQDSVSAFIKQHYSSVVHIPEAILVPVRIEDASMISNWLSDKRGSSSKVFVPERGSMRELLDLADRNARQRLDLELSRNETEREVRAEGLRSLSKHLNLTGIPKRIECFDISNIQGRQSVGSMVVMEDGKLKKQDYRRFKMKSHEGLPDDYEMMREVLSRRFKRFLSGDGKFAVEPDLLLVDGGRGQLNCALEVAAQFGLSHIRCAALAKEHEVIFIPENSKPIVLPYHSSALHLLQQIRNEAHRFAIALHRKRRTETGLHSILDDAPSIGPVRKRALLQHFSSLNAVQTATEEELRKVPSMTRSAAKELWEYLNDFGSPESD